MSNLIQHPKLKEAHASDIFAIFSQVSLDDTSYATVSHEIMLATLSRFLNDPAPKLLLKL